MSDHKTFNFYFTVTKISPKSSNAEFLGASPLSRSLYWTCLGLEKAERRRNWKSGREEMSREEQETLQGKESKK